MGLFRNPSADFISAMGSVYSQSIKAMLPCPSVFYYPGKGTDWSLVRCSLMATPTHARHRADDHWLYWSDEDAAFMLAQYKLIHHPENVR